jgi:hypothetical protein
MQELTADALAKFEKAVTEEFIERLSSFALRRKRSRYWRGVWDGHLPSGKEVEDLVREALHDVLLGRRIWDPDKDPDLMAFMRSVVNSKINHLQTHLENKKEELALVHEDEEGTDHFDTLADDGASTACDQLVTKEDEERNTTLLFAFYDFIATDPPLQRIVGCMLEGITKRAEIAAKLETTEQDITNANKRLDRRFADFRKAYADKNPFKSP